MNKISLTTNHFRLIVLAGLLVISAGCNRTEAQSEHSESRSSNTEQNGQQHLAEVDAHADRLYTAVKQSRNELREMRILAGLHAHASGPHIDPEGHHANDTPEQQQRERNEADGHEDGEGGHEGERGDRGHREGGERGHREGGERGHGEGGERSQAKPGGRIARGTKHVLTYRNGAKLTLQYNPATQAFIGNVTNTTREPLSDIRVEIHLSNGVELGPTKRTMVKPGETIPVELGAFGEEFTHWTTHPEAGNEEAHGPGDEENEHAGGSGGEHGGEGRSERGGHAERERGEHGRESGGHAERERGEHGGRQGESSGSHSHEGAGEGGHGMGDASLRPVYNQMQLLRGEMAAFAADLAASKKGK